VGIGGFCSTDSGEQIVSITIEERSRIDSFVKKFKEGAMDRSSIKNTIQQIATQNSAYHNELRRTLNSLLMSPSASLSEVKSLPVASEPRSIKYDPDSEAMVAVKYLQSFDSAKKRGIEFTLTLADVKRLTRKKKCHYTGVAFDATSEDLCLSFDRIDRKQGYTKKNVVACLSCINKLKNELVEKDGSIFRDNVSGLLSFVSAMKKSMDSVSEIGAGDK
jgi:hypothetical protein